MAYKIQPFHIGDDEGEHETIYLIMKEEQDFAAIASGAETPKCTCDDEDDAKEILSLLNTGRRMMH